MTGVTKPRKKASAEAAPTEMPAERFAEKVEKTQIVDLIAKRELNRKQAATVFDAELISGGKTVGLPGLGTFAAKATAARPGVKPGTAEKIQVPAGKQVWF